MAAPMPYELGVEDEPVDELEVELGDEDELVDEFVDEEGAAGLDSLGLDSAGLDSDEAESELVLDSPDLPAVGGLAPDFG